MSRKYLLGLGALLFAVLVVTALRAGAAGADGKHVSPRALAAILTGPLASPTIGASSGDLTVVEYFDYNCPVCRSMEGELHQLVASDPKVRVIYKDWPVFGAASVYAAYCSYAAAAQGKYAAAHAALIGSREDLDSKEIVRQVMRQAGFDVAKLDADIAAHQKEYSAVLTRNQEEATSLGLRGTPGLIIGDRLIAGGLDFRHLASQVAAARVPN
jgi:protein-disulfide isomerase